MAKYFNALIKAQAGFDVTVLPDSYAEIVALFVASYSPQDRYQAIGTQDAEDGTFLVYLSTQRTGAALELLLSRFPELSLELIAHQPYAAELVSDENGPILDAEGNPQYAVQPYRAVPQSVVDYLPDVVEYDDEGEEISRTAPTEVTPESIGVFSGSEPWVVDPSL
jgi:hypothetical protein